MRSKGIRRLGVVTNKNKSTESDLAFPAKDKGKISIANSICISKQGRRELANMIRDAFSDSFCVYND